MTSVSSTSAASFAGTYGLSGSGLDIDSIVKKLMTSEQTKLDKLVQDKTIAQWQKSAYNKVYDDISDFRDTVFNYTLQKTLTPNTVTSSNTSVATVTANAAASDITHSLMVAQLASGVNLTSTGSITTGADKTTLSGQMGLTSSFTLQISDGSNTKEITVKPSDSINNLVSNINDAGLNIQANYDSTLDRLFLSTTTTGSAAKVSISTTSTDGTNFIKGLKLFSDAQTTTQTTDGTTTTTFTSDSGKDAIFQLDGVALTEASNKFMISGVTYNLTGVTPGSSATDPDNPVFSGQATSISVSDDVDTAIDNIQSLVDSYNKILDELNTDVNETRYTDYPPLTSDQESEMKDSEITLWNEKAKSGMLHSDSTLVSLINSMRSAFSTPVSGISGKYNSASSIGITTGDYTEGGKLHLDTDKLRTALEANPNVLYQLFGSVGTTTTSHGSTEIDTNTQGIAGRLYNTIKTGMDKIDTIASTTSNANYDTSSNLAKKITSYTEQISTEQDRFDTIQAAYYKQYDAMEEALSALNNESSWITSMLSS